MATADGNGRRTFIKALSLAWSYAIIVLFYLLFTTAWVNGGVAAIDINRFGEATFELVLLHAVVLPVITAGMVFLAEDGIGW